MKEAEEKSKAELQVRTEARMGLCAEERRSIDSVAASNLRTDLVIGTSAFRTPGTAGEGSC